MRAEQGGGPEEIRRAIERENRRSWVLPLIPLLALAVAAIAVAVLLARDLPEKRRQLEALQAGLETAQQQNQALAEAFTRQEELLRQQQNGNDDLQQQLQQALDELAELEENYGPLEDQAGTAYQAAPDAGGEDGTVRR